MKTTRFLLLLYIIVSLSPSLKIIHAQYQDKKMRIDLYDLNGRLLFSKADVIDELEIPVSENWNAGIYLIRAKGLNKVYLQKIIIN